MEEESLIDFGAFWLGISEHKVCKFFIKRSRFLVGRQSVYRPRGPPLSLGRLQLCAPIRITAVTDAGLEQRTFEFLPSEILNLDWILELMGGRGILNITDVKVPPQTNRI